ncbi:MAG TPA: thiamine pyrophosphate-binding protein [Xanthobacteraceae bacterium]|jgi:acetolactate synthase-1/2/3 large subunit|nr:thiamine pyrophosphate-binding protein [Xanthobacteraceae bacterium]
MRVVDAIARWFEVAGFQHYFGYAGGSVWPFLDALTEQPQIQGIQAKHENHAVHMADLYHRTTGRVAPVIVNKGPGLLNAVGACASAMHDSSPLLIIAGGGTTHFLGKGGMQEIYYHGFEDAVSIFRPVSKATWMLVRPDTAIDVLNFALKTAVSGRPGPVFVEIPFDIQLAEVEGEIEAPDARAPHRNRHRADRDGVAQVAAMIAEAQRPLLLAGGGVVRADGAAALRKLAEQLDIPVVTTMPAKGALPEDHPLSIGTIGRSGFECAARAGREADLIVAVGARFSDNNTANWRQGSIYDVSKTKIVQVDVDYGEIGRNFPVTLGLVSDAKLFLEDLAAVAKPIGRADWLARVRGFRAEWEKEIHPLLTASSAPTHPARLVHEVGKALPLDGRVYVDIGDVTQYAEAYMTIRSPGAWQVSPGMAEMGWAASGVVGPVAADGRPAVVLVGDGAFNMVSQAVATAVEYALPAVWVVLNNYELGIERKGMERGYKRTHPWCHFVRRDTGEPYNPDYVKLAHAYGAEGVRIEDPAELGPALERAFASRRPWVIDVPVDRSVGSYFTKGIDRAYPDKWAKSYPNYNRLRIVER